MHAVIHVLSCFLPLAVAEIAFFVCHNRWRESTHRHKCTGMPTARFMLNVQQAALFGLLALVPATVLQTLLAPVFAAPFSRSLFGVLAYALTVNGVIEEAAKAAACYVFFAAVIFRNQDEATPKDTVNAVSSFCAAFSFFQKNNRPTENFSDSKSRTVLTHGANSPNPTDVRAAQCMAQVEPKQTKARKTNQNRVLLQSLPHADSTAFALAFVLGVSFGCIENIVYLLTHAAFFPIRLVTTVVLHGACSALSAVFVLSVLAWRTVARRSPKRRAVFGFGGVDYAGGADTAHARAPLPRVAVGSFVLACVLHGLYNFFAVQGGALYWFGVLCIGFALYECAVLYKQTAKGGDL